MIAACSLFKFKIIKKIQVSFFKVSIPQKALFAEANSQHDPWHSKNKRFIPVAT